MLASAKSPMSLGRGYTDDTCQQQSHNIIVTFARAA